MGPIEDKVYELTDSAAQLGFDQLYRRSFSLEEYKLTMAMEKYDGELERVLHPNHYLKFQLRKQVLYGMNFIATGIREGTIRHGILRRRSMGLQILERMFNISKQCSELVVGVEPGLSIYYGKI